jgi:hypothetical protein
VLEALGSATRRASDPLLTRFVALQLATDHSYDLGPARADFGYRERVGLAEATERTCAALLAEPRGVEPPSAAV